MRKLNMATELNKTTFKSEIIDAKANALVDFYAPWCGPCRMMGPIIDSLAAKFPNAKIVKVNIDESPEIAEAYNVSVIPTLVFFKGGEAVNTQVGVVAEAELAKQIQEML